MRIIVMSGKGGVGKTAVAAATALKASQMGQRALVFSVDPAHSLAHALDVPLGPQPRAIAERLFAAELEAAQEVDTHWSEIKGYMITLLRSQGIEHTFGGELSALPGVDEVAALVKLRALIDSGEFDTIVLDNAPTGFALRLMSLPEVLSWYAKQAISLYERYVGQLLMVAPMIGGNVPLPPSGAMASAKSTIDRLKDLPAILADPAVTSVRLVMSADRLALEEAKQTYRYLSLYGLNADAVIVNGFLPDQVTDPFFTTRRRQETAIREQARELFAPLAVWEVPTLGAEVEGLDAVGAFAGALWPEGDPIAPQTRDRAVTIERQDDGSLLVSLRLPFVTSKDVDLAKFQNELYITLGNHRRTLLLPSEAVDMQPIKAKFTEGRLWVTLARS